MDAPSITVRFFRLSEPLQPYFTALYLTVIDAGDARVTDYLHPEWAAMRFTEGPPPVACIGAGEMAPQWPFVAGGPTSLATRFAVTTSRIWGLGLQPAGWAKFAAGDAAGLANRTVDGSAHPAFALFASILPQILACDGDDEAKAGLIEAHLARHADRRVPREDEIVALHEALRDPEIGEVSILQARLGMSAKALERFCRRYFGFAPKVLLRRQRFVRSLAQFIMTSPVRPRVPRVHGREPERVREDAAPDRPADHAPADGRPGRREPARSADDRPLPLARSDTPGAAEAISLDPNPGGR